MAAPLRHGSTDSSADAPLVAFDRVTKRFNGANVLDGLSLAVEPGEFLTLLGPSGCGKSTLLRIAAGLETADGGRVTRPAHGLGYVFQEPTLMPWASVADNVALPLRFARRPAAEIGGRVAHALELVGLADVGRAFPRELSGGMKMRVAIARALVTGPKVLMMDEPFAALDEIGRFRLNDELLRLKEREGWTVIFVTHSVYEAVFLSTRVVVMAAGPGGIVAERRISFAGVRDDALRDSVEFANACRDLSAALRSAVAAEDPGREATGGSLDGMSAKG